MPAEPLAVTDRGVRDLVPDPTTSFVAPSATRWDVAGRVLELADPVVMGVINLTPDSFSDGGRHPSLASALGHAERMLEDGASILDVGGESTRPGAEEVAASVQCERVLPFLREAARRWDVPLSVDTRSAEVARQALDAGARIVNDVSALAHDAEMSRVLADRDAGVILMHMRGTPKTMTDRARYRHVVDEVTDELARSLARAEAAGIDARRVALDPGLGFAKDAQQTLTLAGKTERIVALGRPVVFGPSRKRFLGHVLGTPADERLEGTISACVLAYAMGARVFRVHDVAPVHRSLRVAQAIVEAGKEGG